MAAFATVYQYTPREYEQIYIDELWVLLEALEDRQEQAAEGRKGRGPQRKTGQAALKWLFGGGGK